MLACSGFASVLGVGERLRSPGFFESIVHLDRYLVDVHEQWQGGGLLILHQLLSIHY